MGVGGSPAVGKGGVNRMVTPRATNAQVVVGGLQGEAASS